MNNKSEIITDVRADKGVETLDRFVNDPSTFFDTPNEVVESSDLSSGEKIEVLRAWELDARQRQAAGDESMLPDDSSELPAVIEALRQLNLVPQSPYVSAKIGR